MNPWLIRGVIAAIFSLFGFGAGKVYSDQNNEDARRKQGEENERLRKSLDSILATFAAENQKMEEAVADLVNSPPQNIIELSARLKKRRLSDDQIDRILAKVRASGLYRAA